MGLCDIDKKFVFICAFAVLRNQLIKLPYFLRNACAEEPELRQEVESLLEAAADAGDFMEAGALNDITWPPLSSASATLPTLTPPPPPPPAAAAREAEQPRRTSGALDKLRDAVRRRLAKRSPPEP